MNTEIFIENYRLDISADISTLLNFAIDDIKDFASRSTTWSKTIVLPGTANNNKLFGHIFQIGQANDYTSSSDNVNYNFNAAKSADCIIFQDQMQTFKGVLRLMQINITRGQIEYEVAVFGEISSLSVALSSKFLENLDFSAYNHVYNAANVTGSWANTSGVNYYYPLIDHGTYGSGGTGKKDWDIRTFRPALHVREYIDKMFTAAGFRWSSALFDTARFKTLIVPHNQKQLYAVAAEYLNVSGASETNTDFLTFRPDYPAQNVLNGFAATDANKDTYVYNNPTSINVVARCILTGTYYSPEGTMSIRIRTNLSGGPIKNTVKITLPATADTTLVPFSVDFSGSFEIDQTDTITTRFDRDGPIPVQVNITSGTFTINPEAGERVEISYGGNVVVNDTIPRNIRQIDFLSSLIKLFNLYVYEDRLDRRLIYFTPYIDFYSNKVYPENISINNYGNVATVVSFTNFTINGNNFIAGRLYIFFITTTKATTPEVPTMSGTGQTWDQISSVANSTQRTTAFRFYATANNTNDTTVSVGPNQTSFIQNKIEITGMVTTGTNGADAIVQSVSNSTTGADPSLTLAGISNPNNAVIAVFTNNANPFGGTPESGWTESYDGGNTIPAGGYVMHRLKTTDNTPTVTAASSTWLGIAIEIKSQDAESIDWTYKLNRDKTIKIKPMSELNAKIYNFKYKPDSDFYNEAYRKRYGQGYGDYIFDSEFEFAEANKSFEIAFSATPLVGYSGETKVYSTIFKSSNGVEEKIDSNIRILQSKKITGVPSWDIKDGVTVLSSQTVYGYAGHLDNPDAPANDLNFGALRELFFTLASGDLTKTQFNVYWSSYMAEITDKDSKLLSAWFYLTVKDILTLDFSKKIWIDGVLFRLNAIKDYNASNINDCECELLKINYLIY